MNPVTEHTEIAALTPMESLPLDGVVPLFTPTDSATVGQAGVADVVGSPDGSVIRVTSSVVVGVAVGDVVKDRGAATSTLEIVALPEVEGMDIGS